MAINDEQTIVPRFLGYHPCRCRLIWNNGFTRIELVRDWREFRPVRGYHRELFKAREPGAQVLRSLPELLSRLLNEFTASSRFESLYLCPACSMLAP